MTCPHCRSAAKLAPNPVPTGFNSEPRYRLTCSGCAETTVGAPVKATVNIHSTVLAAA